MSPNKRTSANGKGGRQELRLTGTSASGFPFLKRLPIAAFPVGRRLRWPILPLAAVLFLCAASAQAATITAASCSLANIQAAMNSATSGDTVQVPPGTCTWNSTLSMPNKDLILAGSGGSATQINCPMTCLYIPTSVTTRVTGFAFTFTGSDQDFMNIGRDDTSTAGKTFRVDHNTMTNASGWNVLGVYGAPASAKFPTGLFDHNTFNGTSIHFYGTTALRTEGNVQDALWAQTTTLGDGTDIVFIEDNTFNGGQGNYVDGNYGARYVFRFNTTTGQAAGAEVHSVQGNNRAVQRWEIYKNTFTKAAADWYPLAFIRAGTGVVFGNRLSANYTSDILLDNVRSMGDPGDGVGACNGTSPWDQNTSGMKGYACRDQIGRGNDTVLWTTGAPYSQPLKPAYFWDNIKGANTPVSVLIDGACGSAICLPAPGNNPVHLVENRDWYTQTASFNGSAGVGVGTLAQRPANCTAGVAYWATDQGEWDSTHAGADGQLYKCTAANSWSLYYIPFPYPHPLQGAAAISSSRCDINTDGTTNVADVQLCVNQAISVAACGAGDVNSDAVCNVIDVQRVVNAALGGQCVTQ